MSIDFAPVEAMQISGDWGAAAQVLVERAVRIEEAGANLLLIATNTMHKVAPAIEAAISIPLLHIADATAEAIIAHQRERCVGLLGTRFTMEEDFYLGRLRDTYGITVLTPTEPDRDVVHRIIYDELVLGEIRDGSRVKLARIAENLAAEGARGVILGCTEIGMLLRPGDISVPVYDTTRIHVEAAVAAALQT